VIKCSNGSTPCQIKNGIGGKRGQRKGKAEGFRLFRLKAVRAEGFRLFFFSFPGWSLGTRVQKDERPTSNIEHRTSNNDVAPLR